jgi:hypothetical protein
MNFPEEKSFHQNSKKGGGHRRQEQGRPEISSKGQKLVAEIGGKQEESGMGEVQNVHHAENHGKAGGHQEKDHPIGKPVYSLGDVHGSGRVHQSIRKR